MDFQKALDTVPHEKHYCKENPIAQMTEDVLTQSGFKPSTFLFNTTAHQFLYYLLFIGLNTVIYSPQKVCCNLESI